MEALAFGVIAVPLLAVIGLAFIPANIAKKKGYSAAGFWFFGLFLFFPALIVALVIQDKTQPVYVVQLDGAQSMVGAMPRHVEVASSNTEHYFSGSPLLLVHDVLQKDEVSGQRLIRCTFQNLTEETVIAVYISLECKSVDGNQTQGVDEYVYMDLQVAQGFSFGEDRLIALPDATTTTVIFCLKKVVFVDGRVWQPTAPASFEPVELPTPLSELGILEAQYRRDVPHESSTALLHNLPSRNKDYWRCGCGQINPIQREVCLKCNAALTMQLALKDEATLVQHLEEFERLGAQRRRRVKRAGIGLVAAAVLVAAVVGVSAGIASIAASIERSSLASERQSQLAASPGGFERGAAFSGWIAGANFPYVAVRTDGSVITLDDDRGFDEWSNIIAVASSPTAGEMGVFGLKEDGTILIADGFGYANEPEPSQAIARWSGITQITASEGALFGIKDTGTVEVFLDAPYWIANSYLDFGQFEVASWSGITAVATTWDSTFGLKEDGTVVFVGEETIYEGDEHISYNATENWTDIVAIAGGRNHVVGLKKDGTVVATGDNADGQCDVEGWSDIIAVSATQFYTFGLKEDGSLVMVGNTGLGFDCEECLDWSDIVAIYATDSYIAGLKVDGTIAVAGTSSDYFKSWSNIGRYRQP